MPPLEPKDPQGEMTVRKRTVINKMSPGVLIRYLKREQVTLEINLRSFIQLSPEICFPEQISRVVFWSRDQKLPIVLY